MSVAQRFHDKTSNPRDSLPSCAKLLSRSPVSPDPCAMHSCSGEPIKKLPTPVGFSSWKVFGPQKSFRSDLRLQLKFRSAAPFPGQRALQAGEWKQVFPNLPSLDSLMFKVIIDPGPGIYLCGETNIWVVVRPCRYEYDETTQLFRHLPLAIATRER
jgi:hypothetical protein